MNKYILLIVLILLSSCKSLSEGGESEVNKIDKLNIVNNYIVINGIEYDINRIEYVHKRGWLQTIYDKKGILMEKPDFIEKYYTINEPKYFFDENEQKKYYIVSGDTLLTQELWEENIKQTKENIKNIMILSQGNQKFVLYENSISKLSDFEESWNITFNLGKYKTITIPE